MAEKTNLINKKIAGNERHWKSFLDKDYLGSHNLEKGEEFLLTIEKFEGQEMVTRIENKKKSEVPKMVLYFKEDVPKMILNVTNASQIEALYGPHPAQWIGKQIQVFATPVNAFGKTQDALRIRDFAPSRSVKVSDMTAKLDEASNMDELVTIWRSLPASAQLHQQVIDHKNALKNKFASAS